MSLDDAFSLSTCIERYLKIKLHLNIKPLKIYVSVILIITEFVLVS